MACTLLGGLLVLGGCDLAGTSDDAVVVEGGFPIAFVERSVDAVGNPTDGATFSPGGDLFTLDLSSPSAQKVNITESYTQGQGDVSDPEVSYDATKLLFSMRGPNDSTWSVWEYDIPSQTLTRKIWDDATANEGDDVDPAYLPDGRIVFSSNRQEKTRQLLMQDGVEPYAYRDEYERERTLVLHVMDTDGTNINQISFNQSHDRNATVLNTGEIMFARWDHVGGRNHFPIFFTNPDGTNIFVQYGAFSPGNSMLHPREMPDGRVMSSLMPLSGTREGGALMAVDIRNFSENDQPAPGAPAGGSGQVQLAPPGFEINFGQGISEFGRYTTPYPLWDGTNRALVSWTPSRPETETDALTSQSMDVEGPPHYGIYMIDMDNSTLKPIILPDDGRALTDAVAIMPRPVPNVVADKPLDATLAAEGVGILNVKSIYDTDVLDIMGQSVLVSGESLPMIPAPAGDTRSQVADLALLKQTPADSRPGRFVRVTQAVPTPPGVSRETIGETMMEMQQLVGYSEVEPDGSFKIKVPADRPLTVAIVDSEGRAFQTHTNWLQVRPGETRTCNGCHSPRRGSALNSAPIAGAHLNAESGESMAETRTRMTPGDMDLLDDMDSQDIWMTPSSSLRITYAGLTTPAPTNGIVNYPEHIQPIWDANRSGGACTSCHGVSDDLNLRDDTAGTGRLVSYEELMVGDPILDPNTGLPVLTVDDGEIMLERETPLVTTGRSSNSSRSSHLVEKLFEQELRAEQDLAPFTVDHSTMLNSAEKRVVFEWMDLGGQYYNDAFDDADADNFRALSEVRGAGLSLSESVFETDVHDTLMQECAGCHQPFGGNGLPSNNVNANFLPNRFVLTGNVEGDFNVTTTMVNNVCDPAQSYLLARPTSDETGVLPHPSVPDANDPNITTPVLSAGSPVYTSISDWIFSACGS